MRKPQYRDGHGDSSRFALSNAIADLFYGDSRAEPSYFNERVVALANDFMRQGTSVAIVTPNYDDFLIDAIARAKDAGLAGFDDYKPILFGMADGDEARPTSEQTTQLNTALRTPGTLVIVHLHGLVPRSASPSSLLGELKLPRNVFPVVSERDYSLTRINSERVLKKLFTRRDVLVVGSSLTDPPLLNALTSTRAGAATQQRYAIRPLQGLDLSRLEDRTFDAFRRVENDRARLMGIKLISPPFFYQAPQLLEESRIALELHVPASGDRPRGYADLGSTPRYGSRLVDWWNYWREDDQYPLDQMQLFSHKFLTELVLPTIRRILDTPPEEDLRVEAWMRWEPEQRELRLWASSIGSWPNMQIARRDRIRVNGNYLATGAFLNGSPTYAEGLAPATRWKSFLSKPVRFTDSRGSIPVGVISVASMKSQAASSLNPRNKDTSGDLFRVLEVAGLALFSPQNKYIFHNAIEDGGFDGLALEF